jgi:hypothetical protein
MVECVVEFITTATYVAGQIRIQFLTPWTLTRMEAQDEAQYGTVSRDDLHFPHTLGERVDSCDALEVIVFDLRWH